VCIHVPGPFFSAFVLQWPSGFVCAPPYLPTSRFRLRGDLRKGKTNGGSELFANTLSSRFPFISVALWTKELILSFLSPPPSHSFLTVVVQSSFQPLPETRPLVILVPIMNESPQKMSNLPSTTTPSAVCFPSPPNSSTSVISSFLDRALGFLRRAKRELAAEKPKEDASPVVIMGM
jgi:hypothetical protein